MLYLLDSNVLIDAQRDYYPIERIPEFWEWLEFQSAQDQIKVPVEVYDEVKIGKDALAQWVKDHKHVLLHEDADPEIVAEVVNLGYAPDLRDDEIANLGRDPFLIAYAVVAPFDRCVVTTEVSKPSRQRANRHIPDVCRDLGVLCCHTFELTRRLNFSTRWRNPASD